MSGTAAVSSLRGSALGALAGAALVALGVTGYEALQVAVGGGSFMASNAVLAVGFILALGGALGGLAVALLLRFSLRGLERVQIEWSAVIAAMLGASLTVLGAQGWVLEMLSGAGIRTATVALSGAVGAVVGVAIAAAIRGMLRGRTAGPRLQIAISALGLVALVISVVALSPGFVEELDVPGLCALLAPLLGGITGAIAGLHARRAARITLIVLGVLALQTVLYVASPRPGRMLLLAQRHTHAARNVLRAISPKPAALPMTHPGTCHPGVVSGPIQGNAKAASDAPDLLVITTDAVRWDHTPMGGYKRNTTPELAKWARTAAIFTSAHTPASSTRQTFRALFTGMFPSQVPESRGDNWWGVSFVKGQRTLATYLRDAGYLTISANDRLEGFNPMHGALDGFTEQLKRVRLRGDSGTRRGGRAVNQLKQAAEAMTKPADAPRFMWLHIAATHQPYSVGVPSPFGKTEIDRYDGAIQFVDREIGRVLAALKRSKRLERTVVVWSADHGQAFREHGTTLHGHTVYQEETRVPLMVWGPGVRAGRRNDPVSTLDVFPTLLDFAGLGTVGAVCGSSLVPTLRDPKQVPGRDVYIEQVPDSAPYFAYALIRGRYKLIVTPRQDSTELFDIRADPAEKKDITEQKPELFGKMLKALAEHQKRHGLDPRSYPIP